ncbi:MAG: hypothetical protein ACRBDI_09870 [Alphaproteobacteria bacterium]
MVKSQKILLLATIASFAGFGFNSVNATDIDVDATMTASAAVSVAKSADLDFGGIDFVAVHSGVVQLGPDGNAALVGPVGLTLTGTPAAGQLDVTSSAGTILVSCDATAIIDDGATPLSVTEVVWDETATDYTTAAAANTCGGVGVGAGSIDTGVSNNPSIFIGAELTIGSNVLNGSSGATPFDTSTGTGNPVTFRLVFQ